MKALPLNAHIADFSRGRITPGATAAYVHVRQTSRPLTLAAMGAALKRGPGRCTPLPAMIEHCYRSRHGTRHFCGPDASANHPHPAQHPPSLHIRRIQSALTEQPIRPETCSGGVQMHILEEK